MGLRIIIVVLLILLLQPVMSQISDEVSVSNKNRYSFGITPLAFLNKYPGFQLSHNLDIYGPFSMGLESAYIFYISDADFERAKGFRLRPSLKTRLSDSENFSIGFGFFYNYRRTKAFREVESVRAGGSFIQIIDGSLNSSLSGWGLQLDFDMQKELPDFYFSVGLGRGRIVNEYTDPELEISRFFGINVNPGRSRDYVIIFFGVHYRFLKLG